MARTVEDRLTLACLKLLFKEREEVMKEIGALVGMGVNEHAFLHGLECEGVAGLVYFTLSQDSSAKTLFADGILTKPPSQGLSKGEPATRKQARAWPVTSSAV